MNWSRAPVGRRWPFLIGMGAAETPPTKLFKIIFVTVFLTTRFFSYSKIVWAVYVFVSLSQLNSFELHSSSRPTSLELLSSPYMGQFLFWFSPRQFEEGWGSWIEKSFLINGRCSMTALHLSHIRPLISFSPFRRTISLGASGEKRELLRSPSFFDDDIAPPILLLYPQVLSVFQVKNIRHCCRSLCSSASLSLCPISPSYSNTKGGQFKNMTRL